MDEIRLTVRLPEALKLALERQARAARRSTNAELLIILEAALGHEAAR